MIDGAVDPRGRFWTATTNTASLSNGGHLVILDRDRKARYVRTSVGLSGSIGFSPDGRWLYQADERARRITRARCDPERGTLGLQDAFIDVSGYLGRSSGIAVDMYGAVWLAFPEGEVVRRFDPNGQLMDEISTPTSAPTGCAFGGPELRTLFVTAVDTSPGLAAAAAAQPSTTLLALDAPQRGLLSNRWIG
jgi:sugar lactone lactonase YvrE